MDRSTWRTLRSDLAAVTAPADLSFHPHGSGPPDADLTFMATAKSSAVVPSITILAHRPLTADPRTVLRATAASMDAVLEDAPFELPGTSDGWLVRGHWVLPESLTEDGSELLTQVVVPVAEQLVSLVVRVAADAPDARDLSDEILSTFAVG